MKTHIRDIIETTTPEDTENVIVLNTHMAMRSVILQSEKRSANNFIITNSKSYADHILGLHTRPDCLWCQQG